MATEDRGKRASRKRERYSENDRRGIGFRGGVSRGSRAAWN